VDCVGDEPGAWPEVVAAPAAAADALGTVGEFDAGGVVVEAEPEPEGSWGVKSLGSKVGDAQVPE
jgi:hypothetical protein